MADGSTRYAKTLSFRPIDPERDKAKLIDFGEGLYIESLGDARGFARDYGPGGERFPKWIASCAARNNDFAAFLLEEGVAIGMVVLGASGTSKDMGHVHHFYIRQSWRGQGFGGLLDDYARRILKAAGFERARLNVARGNERALRFYVAQGWAFSDSGQKPNSILRHMEVAL